MKKQVLPENFSSLFSVIALPVEKSEFLFAQIRVGDFDFDLAERAIALTVRWRVGDQVLRAQLGLNLCECCVQLRFVLRKEDAPARFLRDVAERLAVNLELFRV